ncbi:TPA: hypothetical protein EYP66_08815 [Candidatus Poribacteria bacterium]|nr:hypothetical protein [Candidatus Poribacteria bacterium]
MNKKYSIIIPCLLLLTSAIFSCGYFSTSNYLPHIDTINIPLVTVETPEVDIGFDEQVTQALRDKFRSKWQEGGDSVLTMTIKDYRIDPISFDANNQPEQFRMRLFLDYNFYDNKKNKIIDAKKDYVQTHDFFIVSVRGEEPETKEFAIEKLIEELSDELYNSLAEQW